jgi:hypothetical protein
VKGFARLPVSWTEPEEQPATLIHLPKTREMRTGSLRYLLRLLRAELRAVEFWETCGYGLLWLCALISFWSCFR